MSPSLKLSEKELANIIAQARELGISFILLAGGEPLARENILIITKDYPDVLFFIFTNGLLISDDG